MKTAATRLMQPKSNVISLSDTQSDWLANLWLEFSWLNGRTLLSRKLHNGPLLIQKTLYPEGENICHGIIIHPPGGVAGGDQLSVDVALAEQARVLLTTPGAGKWYKANGKQASQKLRFKLQSAAILEWLPQETIIFDGAEVHWQTRIELEADASYMGWEIVCFGRSAFGEKFRHGNLRQQTEIFQEDKRIWGEYASIKGGDKLLSSPAGLADRSVYGTFLLAGFLISDELLKEIRTIKLENSPEDVSGITRIGNMLAIRYLGNSSESARQYFVAVWSLLRPAVCGREASKPRIWNT